MIQQYVAVFSRALLAASGWLIHHSCTQASLAVRPSLPTWHCLCYLQAEPAEQGAGPAALGGAAPAPGAGGGAGQQGAGGVHQKLVSGVGVGGWLGCLHVASSLCSALC